MKLVILDRDGVINQDPLGYIGKPEEWHAFPGSLEAIAQFNKAGIWVAVCSNQSGIGRGYFTAEDLKAVHDKMQDDLRRLHAHVDAIYYCPHHPDEQCNCRKPKTQMLENMQAHFKVEKKDMLFIGDSATDIETAENFGCAAVLVLTGYGERTAKTVTHVPLYKDLHSAAEALLGKKS